MATLVFGYEPVPGRLRRPYSVCAKPHALPPLHTPRAGNKWKTQNGKFSSIQRLPATECVSVFWASLERVRRMFLRLVDQSGEHRRQASSDSKNCLDSIVEFSAM